MKFRHYDNSIVTFRHYDNSIVTFRHYDDTILTFRHYERKGLAYCETHYHQLFGNLCYTCNQVIQTDVFTALNKAWCVNHFACSSCDQKMTVKTKFYEVD